MKSAPWVVSAVVISVLAGCGSSHVRTALNRAVAPTIRAHNGRYTVQQIKHAFASVGAPCPTQKDYSSEGYVVLLCPPRRSQFYVDILAPGRHGGMNYGVASAALHWATRRNVTLSYRSAQRPVAQEVLSLLR